MTAAPTTNPAADPAVTRPRRPGRRVVAGWSGCRPTPAAVPDGAVRAVVLWQSFSAEYRPDGQQGVHGADRAGDGAAGVGGRGLEGDQVGGPPVGMDTVVLGGVVPVSFPVPAENWHR